jgi:hypothetical protein
MGMSPLPNMGNSCGKPRSSCNFLTLDGRVSARICVYGSIVEKRIWEVEINHSNLEA